MPIDNGTLAQKIQLRQELLSHISPPLILETNGGVGAIYARLYSCFAGVVFERDTTKALQLARQRPKWSVYEGDTEKALAGGAAAHLPVNFLDVDPWGDPWPYLSAFFSSERPFPETLCVAVTDGLRHRLNISPFRVHSLESEIQTHGAEYAKRHYLDLCREKFGRVAIGYTVDHWKCYSCGSNKTMTHYAARLIKVRVATCAETTRPPAR